MSNSSASWLSYHSISQGNNGQYASRQAGGCSSHQRLKRKNLPYFGRGTIDIKE
jgi:hypothetical protein